jgi:hypothetical protein
MIRDESDFISSPRGMKIKEKLGVGAKLDAPADDGPAVDF